MPRFAHPAGKTSGGVGVLRFAEQTSRCETRRQRNHREGTPRPGDAEDESGILGPPGEDGIDSSPNKAFEAKPRPGVMPCEFPGIRNVYERGQMRRSSAGSESWGRQSEFFHRSILVDNFTRVSTVQSDLCGD